MSLWTVHSDDAKAALRVGSGGGGGDDDADAGAPAPLPKRPPRLHPAASSAAARRCCTAIIFEYSVLGLAPCPAAATRRLVRPAGLPREPSGAAAGDRAAAALRSGDVGKAAVPTREPIVSRYQSSEKRSPLLGSSPKERVGIVYLGVEEGAGLRMGTVRSLLRRRLARR
jgi:hypothetical protein